MAKRKEPIIIKDDYSDSIDVDFSTSDDNADLILRELDIVTQHLERDAQHQSVQRSKAKNRERVNEAQRQWRRQNPDKVREYDAHRDKDAERKRARELYQLHIDAERERQRIIREKRRAAKLAEQGGATDAPTVAEKLSKGTKKITKRKSTVIGDITKSNGDMEL